MSKDPYETVRRPEEPEWLAPGAKVAIIASGDRWAGDDRRLCNVVGETEIVCLTKTVVVLADGTKFPRVARIGVEPLTREHTGGSRWFPVRHRLVSHDDPAVGEWNGYVREQNALDRFVNLVEEFERSRFDGGSNCRYHFQDVSLLPAIRSALDTLEAAVAARPDAGDER